MNSQPISLIRGHDSVVPVRIELGYAPLDLSTATAATFTAKPGEFSTVVKITKTLGSGVTAGLLGLANISFSVADMAELDVSNSYTWSLTATVGGVASIVARGVLTAIGEPQQFVDEGVDQVARDLAASKASPEQAAAVTAAHNADAGAHWFTAPLSLVKAFPRVANFSDRVVYSTGDGRSLPTQREGMTVSTGTTANSVCVLSQEPGFGAMRPSGADFDVSVPANSKFAFELSVNVKLSGSGTARLSFAKAANVDGPGRRAPSFGFEFRLGQARGFWKTNVAEDESAWFPYANQNTQRVGIYKDGAVVALYCGGIKVGEMVSAEAIQIEYSRGFAIEVANSDTSADMQAFAGFCQFSIQ